jgi:hypothetical protein
LHPHYNLESKIEDYSDCKGQIKRFCFRVKESPKTAVTSTKRVICEVAADENEGAQQKPLRRIDDVGGRYDEVAVYKEQQNKRGYFEVVEL